MLKRLAAMAALVALMGCAGLEPAGRNARAPQAAPPVPRVVSAPAPVVTPPPAPVATTTPPVVAAAPPPVATAPPPVVAVAPPPRVVTQAAPTPAPTAAAREEEPERITTASRNSGDIVVPAERERQVPAPDGDPRSTSERMQDINSWDRCVTNVQAAFERDPMRPQLQSPEEYCSQSLGMSNRNAIPISRVDPRR